MKSNVNSSVRHLAVVGALIAVAGLLAASTAAAKTTNVPIWTSGGTNLPFGSQVSFSGSSLSGMNLKWTSSGIPIWIQCETLSASGTVEDYASGKAGTLTPGAPYKFEGCQVVQVGKQTAENNTTCQVPSEIPLEHTSGELTNTPYSGGGLKLSGLYMTFQINGCPGGAFEHYTWKLAGSPTGNEGAGAWPGEVLYPEGTAVTLSGVSGEMQFGLRLQDGSGAPIVIAEEEISDPNTPGHHYWYTGGGMRKGEGPRTLVTPGSPLTITGASNAITLEATISGLLVKIVCGGSGSTTGTVENPAGELDGVANASFGFGGCTVAKPEGKSCTVEGGSITTASMPGTLYGTGTLLDFTPTSGTIATFEVGGCTIGSLNGSYKLKGSLFAQGVLDTSLPGKWSIPYSENQGKGLLKLRGQAASAAGSVSAETSGGEAVTLY